MKTPRAVLHQIAIDAWSAGTILLVLCLALETAERGFVSRFFNLLWLVLFAVAASLAALLLQPRAADGELPTRRAGGAAEGLLRLGMLLLAPAAWLLLPESVKLFWRAAAAGGILLTALAAGPVFSKKE